MKKSLFPLLIALSMTLVALPGFSHADADGGDYVAMRVPDVTQAVTFFRNAMNCSVIGAGTPEPANGQTTLMACGRETTIEISQATASSSATAAHRPVNAPLTLDTDDSASMTAWLHARHMRSIGSPVRLSSGADAGKIAVTFLTPWGQPLELISRARADDSMPTKSPQSQVAVK